MKVLVLSLGFTVEYLVRIISTRGTSDINKIIIFTSFGEDPLSRKRSEDTINYAKDYLTKAGLEYEIKALDISKSFLNVVLQIAEVLRKYNEMEIYILGGMRLFALSLYYYGLIAKNLNKNVKVVLYTEDMTLKGELPLTIPKSLKEEEIKILKNLNDKKTIKDLAELLQKSVSTISKQIDSLEENNLVQCKRIGNSKECTITELGKILLQLDDRNV
ncbi:CRISPR-associated CARF protein Csa3 [Metallosphaera javensis (ex Sakai et al. 2022)]|uniref:CRISPR-associated CARF protein Csa3 n=1 Tax=Metallosphaera javensis (ex Sakai et al. 2022) TaxID=2775498 RepID=UPI002584D006|nr:MAG: CRISPR-associated transcriptional regulator Csa3 [Metallosphaera javensis (ex Sakai et al. 2022)]